MNRVARMAMPTVAFTALALASAAAPAAAAVAPPNIAKAFGQSSIPLNGSTTLAVTITHPSSNAVPQPRAPFADNLPPALTVAVSPGLTNTCGGTATGAGGGSSLTLTGGTIPTNSTCSVTVIVTGVTRGLKNNTTAPVSSTNGGTGNAAS